MRQLWNALVLIGILSTCAEKRGAPPSTYLVFLEPQDQSSDYKGPLRASFGISGHIPDAVMESLTKSLFLEDAASGGAIPFAQRVFNPPIPPNVYVAKGGSQPEGAGTYDARAYVEVIPPELKGWSRFGVRRDFTGVVHEIGTTSLAPGGNRFVRFIQASRPIVKSITFCDKAPGVTRATIEVSEPIDARASEVNERLSVSSSSGRCLKQAEADPSTAVTSHVDLECPAGSSAKSTWQIAVTAGLRSANGAALVLPSGLEEWRLGVPGDTLVPGDVGCFNFVPSYLNSEK